MTSCYDIVIFNIETGTWLDTLEGHSDWIRSIIELSNNRIASCSEDDGTIKIWDINTGECLKTIEA